MKFWGVLIAVLSFSFYGMAQTNMDAVFSADNQNLIYTGQPKDYTGSPVVFIEGVSDEKSSEDKESIKPLPPLQHSNIQNSIKINSGFGHEKEVAFIPHTVDWNFIIQILNDDEIAVKEEILFIKTNEITVLIRDWPKQDFYLTESRINGQNLALKPIKEKEKLVLKLPDLETGLHKLNLSYTIKNAGIFSQKSAKIVLPLMGSGWDLPTDSLKGVILFPNQVKNSTLSFLFGKNKLEIKEAFQIQSDKNGNLFFRSAHLIPASSPMQLNLHLQFDSFVKRGIWDKLAESTSFLIFIISLGIICLYLLLNLIEIKISSEEEVALRKKMSPKNSVLKAFLNRTGEIWIGLILLWGGTFLALYFTSSFFSTIEIQFLIFIPCLFVFILDHFILKKRQQKLYLIQSEFKKDIKK